MDPLCNICGHQGPFINPDRGKEGWHCTNCSSSSRNRLVTYTLGKALGLDTRPAYLWPSMKHLKLLEPSPRGPQTVFFRDKFDYVDPEYDSNEIEAGAPPEKYADVQDLKFPDGSFDIVVCSDVFEHVRDDKKGFREVYRTLKGGGTFLLTVPYDHARERTIARVDTRGEDDVHILEPRYAGGGGATLDYREYGRDLLEQLAQTGFAVAHINTGVQPFQIFKSSIFICQKSGYLDLSKYMSSDPGHALYHPLGVLLPNRIFLNYKFNLRSFFHFGKEAKRRILS